MHNNVDTHTCLFNVPEFRKIAKLLLGEIDESPESNLYNDFILIHHMRVTTGLGLFSSNDDIFIEISKTPAIMENVSQLEWAKVLSILDSRDKRMASFTEL